MKISTRGRYALRMMLDIALHPEEHSVSLKSIAQRQQISVKYLEQIVTPLVKGGYLRANRGAQGGYQLTRSPEEYTVGTILRTIEVYRRIDEAIDQVVDGITLADLVKLQEEKWDQDPESREIAQG